MPPAVSHPVEDLDPFRMRSARRADALRVAPVAPAAGLARGDDREHVVLPEHSAGMADVVAGDEPVRPERHHDEAWQAMQALLAPDDRLALAPLATALGVDVEPPAGERIDGQQHHRVADREWGGTLRDVLLRARGLDIAAPGTGG